MNKLSNTRKREIMFLKLGVHKSPKEGKLDRCEMF